MTFVIIFTITSIQQPMQQSVAFTVDLASEYPSISQTVFDEYLIAYL